MRSRFGNIKHDRSIDLFFINIADILCVMIFFFFDEKKYAMYRTTIASIIFFFLYDFVVSN